MMKRVGKYLCSFIMLLVCIMFIMPTVNVEAGTGGTIYPSRTGYYYFTLDGSTYRVNLSIGTTQTNTHYWVSQSMTCIRGSGGAWIDSGTWTFSDGYDVGYDYSRPSEYSPGDREYRLRSVIHYSKTGYHVGAVICTGAAGVASPSKVESYTDSTATLLISTNDCGITNWYDYENWYHSTLGLRLDINQYTMTSNHYKYNASTGNWDYWKSTTATANYGTTYTPSYSTPTGYSNYKRDWNGGWTVTNNASFAVYYYPNSYTQTMYHHYNYGGGGNVLFSTTTASAYYNTVFTPSYTTVPRGYYASSRDWNGGWTVSGNHDFNLYYSPYSYTQTFVNNGGTMNGSTSNFSNTVTYDSVNCYNMTIYAAASARKGYIFNGYWTASSGGTQVYSASGYVTNEGTYWSGNRWHGLNNVTLYAQWIPIQYTISFNSNKPSNATSNVTGTMANMTGNKYDIYYPLRSNTYALTGWIFQGWNTKADGTGTSYSHAAQVRNLTATNGATVTLYAQWKPIEYSVQFNTNKPGNASSNVVGRISTMAGFKYDTAYDLINYGYTLTGWMFSGWNSKADGSGTGSGTIKNLTTTNGATVTLYAQWEPIKYTVQFDNNELHGSGKATGSMSSVVLTYDVPSNLPANQFIKTTAGNIENEGGNISTRYSIYKGWSRVSTDLRPTWTDKQTVVNLTTKNNDVITFYAIWDDSPDFIVTEYPNRHFTLDEARAGYITETELLNTLKVVDRETNLLVKKTAADVVRTGNDIGITIPNYDASEFTSLTDDSIVLITYQLKDDSGSTAVLNIRVTISDNAPLVEPDTSYVRGISDKYYANDVTNGGLNSSSKWLTDSLYSSKLSNALTTDSYLYQISLDKSDIESVKQHIDANGFGNSENSNALSDLFNRIK